MVEDDVAIQDLCICCKAFFEDNGIKLDRAELLSLNKYTSGILQLQNFQS